MAHELWHLVDDRDGGAAVARQNGHPTKPMP